MHMMVSRPEQWVKPMSAAGANQYTFHLESTTNPGNLIKEIREAGMKVSWQPLHHIGFALGVYLCIGCVPFWKSIKLAFPFH